MKAFLVFDLPEDDPLFADAVNGSRWRGVVRTVDAHLKQSIKHGHGYKTADEALAETRSFMQSAIREENMQLFD